MHSMTMKKLTACSQTNMFDRAVNDIENELLFFKNEGAVIELHPFKVDRFSDQNFWSQLWYTWHSNNALTESLQTHSSDSSDNVYSNCVLFL